MRSDVSHPTMVRRRPLHRTRASGNAALRGGPWNQRPFGAVGRIGVLALLLVASAMSAAAQSDRCADCHAANTTTSMEQSQRYHLLDWQLSTHSRAKVGCASCHGGDTSTFEFVPAHHGIRHSAQPESPTHFANLPTTCGSCHQEVAKQFEGSRHGQLVRAGNRNAPTCTTCHSSVGAFLLSSRGLERQCASCHDERASHPRPGRAEFASELHERFRSIRAQLKGIRRLAGSRTSNSFSAHLESTEAALHDAAAGAHSFDLAATEAALAESEQRLDSVRLALASLMSASDPP